MLYMTVLSWEPAKRDEVIKRRAEGAKVPEGMKLIGEWVDVAGGQVFRLAEIDRADVLLRASLAWGDLGTIEAFPVMETEEVMKVIAGG